MKIIMENWRKYIYLIEQKENNEALVQFIIRSNQIEGYETAAEDIINAIEGLKQGYPLRYVTQDPHIYSHLAGIEAAKSGGRDVASILNVHKAMGSGALEAGAPGQLRTGGAQSEHGTQYVPGEQVGEALQWWVSQDWQDPFESHTVYELIHPFDDGNGRSGRILLAAMFGFDYRKVNELIGSSYFTRLDNIGAKYQGEFWK